MRADFLGRGLVFDANVMCAKQLPAGLGCNCFRRNVFNSLRGSKLGAQQQEAIKHVFNCEMSGDAQQFEPMARSLEDLAFQTHFVGVLGYSPDALFDTVRPRVHVPRDVLVPKEAVRRYHPSAGTKDLVKVGKDVLGDQQYPHSAAVTYLQGLHALVDKTSEMLDASINSGEASVAQITRLAECAMRDEDVRLMNAMRAALHGSGAAAALAKDPRAPWEDVVAAAAAEARAAGAAADDQSNELVDIYKKMHRPQRMTWLNHGVYPAGVVTTLVNSIRKKQEHVATRLAAAAIGGGGGGGGGGARGGGGAGGAGPSSSRATR